MKLRNFTLIFIFGVFLFLLPNFAEAACPLSCGASCEPVGVAGHSCLENDCKWGPTYPQLSCFSNERLGIVGTVDQQTVGTGVCDIMDGTADGFCSTGSGKCKGGAFPSGSNGQRCTGKDGKWHLSGCDYYECDKTGKWDASQSQCVTCSGKVENLIIGNTSQVNAVCDTLPAGNGKCESACGANTACDEVSDGNQCTVGKYCEALGRNCQSGDKCSGCVCTAPSGCTIGGTNYAHGQCNPANKCQICDVNQSTTSWSNVPSMYVCSASGMVLVSSTNYCNYDEDCDNGDCYATKWYTSCNGSGACRVASDHTNAYAVDVTASAGKVLTSTCGNQDATADVKCASTVNKCTAGQCSGEKRYPECQSGGTCDSSATSYYTPETVYAATGYTLTSTCGTSGTTLCGYSSWNACNGPCQKKRDKLRCDSSHNCNYDVGDDYSNCSADTACSGGTCSSLNYCATNQCRDGGGWHHKCSKRCDGSNNCTNWADATCVDHCTNGIQDCDETGVDTGGSCPVGCSGSLTVSISGSGTCTVTASLTASNCNGQAWQIKDDGNIKCSGTVSGSPYSYTCSSWTVSTGTYTYNLYIGGALKNSKSVTCSATANNPPTCNYLNASPTSGNAPLTISFTGNGSDSDGSIVEYEFDFGDGSPKVYSSTAGATHTYNAVSTYCAKLRVKDDDGAWSTNTGSCPGGTCTVQITVIEAGAGINPPGVTTNPATNITTNSATLNGILNGMGNAFSCLVWFEWGITTSYGNSTPVQIMTSTGVFSANISGLTSNTTYYFVAKAKNGGSWQAMR